MPLPGFFPDEAGRLQFAEKDSMNPSDISSNINLQDLNSIAGNIGALSGGFSVPSLIFGMIFGGIGFVAFTYGKSRANFKLMVIGGLLFIYPYFVPGAALNCTIGVVLTVLLYFCRE